MGDRPFLVIDTGGFEPVVKEGVMQEMAKADEAGRRRSGCRYFHRRWTSGNHTA